MSRSHTVPLVTMAWALATVTLITLGPSYTRDRAGLLSYGAQINTLAGCYTLHLGTWSPSTWPAGPPATFRLHPELLPPPFSSDSVLRASPQLEVYEAEWPAMWRPLGSDSLMVSWTNGLWGVGLELRRTQDALVGRVVGLSDVIVTDSDLVTAPATAYRIDCEHLRGVADQGLPPN